MSLRHMNELVQQIVATGEPEMDFLLVTGELLVLDAEACWRDEVRPSRNRL